MTNIIQIPTRRTLPGITPVSARVKALDEFQALFERRPAPAPVHEPAPAPAPVPPKKPSVLVIVARGIKALRKLTPFMGVSQRKTVEIALRGEEGEWFMEKMEELAARVESMPVTYGQDGKGDDAICYLHYFGGAYDGYITEKDMEEPENPAEAQWQAHGYVHWQQSPGHLSLGYICLPEILASNMELDFHFEPTTVREIKRKHGIGVPEETAAETCLKAPVSDSETNPSGEAASRLAGGNSDSDPEAAPADHDETPETGFSHPLNALRYHVTGAIERGEGHAIVETPPATDEDPLITRQKTYLAMPDGYQAGAIISYSWGWEQTNYNYYRIEKRSGDFITLIPLVSRSIPTGDMHSDEFPTDTPKDYAKDHDPAWGNKNLENPKPAFRRKITIRDGKPSGFSISSGTGWARLWEGRVGKATHYA